MKNKIAKLVRRLTTWAWRPQIEEAFVFYAALDRIAKGEKMPVQIARQTIKHFHRRG
jgi:hypothetical protein